MQFAALATLFAAALAAPAPQTTDCPNPAHCGSPPDPSTYDNVDISNLFVRKNPDVKSFDFDIKGANGTARCEADSFDKLPQIVVCGDSNYRAGLTELTEDGKAEISVYRQTGPAFGMYGTGKSS